MTTNILYYEDIYSHPYLFYNYKWRYIITSLILTPITTRPHRPTYILLEPIYMREIPAQSVIIYQNKLFMRFRYRWSVGLISIFTVILFIYLFIHLSVGISDPEWRLGILSICVQWNSLVIAGFEYQMQCPQYFSWENCVRCWYRAKLYSCLIPKG